MINKYYDDYRVLQFSDEVVDVLLEDNRYWIGTNTSSFFVAAGGMSNDEGLLNDLKVIDLKYINGIYYHLVDQKLRETVVGVVNYQNRIQKVQIHSAQHLISAYLNNTYKLQTISHHVSTDDNDIEFIGVDTIDVVHMQSMLNRYLLDNLPVTIFYPTVDEALKKADISKLNHQELRVVQIGDLDYNLCGCLHVNSLSEIGSIFIKGYEKTKTGIIVHYLAGSQIIDYFKPRFEVLNQVGKILALDHLHLTKGVEQLLSDNKETHYLLTGQKQKYLSFLADQLILNQSEIILELSDYLIKDGQYMVSYLKNKVPDIAVALVMMLSDNACHVILSGDKMVSLFPFIATQYNLNGGGNQHLAQGGGSYQISIITTIKDLFFAGK